MMPFFAGSLPRKMFSAIESSGTSASSWWMMTMPAFSLSAMSRNLHFLTLEQDLAGIVAMRIDAAHTFIRVDLPAPFSPTTGVDLAGAHREVDVVQRVHAGKCLGDAAHLQDRFPRPGSSRHRLRQMGASEFAYHALLTCGR
jgi:hypothetical protein